MHEANGPGPRSAGDGREHARDLRQERAAGIFEIIGALIMPDCHVIRRSRVIINRYRFSR
jgi:hypothetical protein